MRVDLGLVQEKLGEQGTARLVSGLDPVPSASPAPTERRVFHDLEPTPAPTPSERPEFARALRHVRVIGH